MVRSSWRQKHQPFVTFFAILLMIIFLYPFWETTVISFSKPDFAESLGVKLWPKTGFTLDAYKEVFESNNVWLAFYNNIFRTVVTTFLCLCVNFCAAYALAHKQLPGRSVITFYFVFTMFFGGGLIPGYMNMRELGISGTRWAWILPGMAGVYSMLITRNFIMAMGTELEESAQVDGANGLQVMLRIILPLSGAVLAVTGLWAAVANWNNWFGALLYTPQPELIVLPLLVQRVIATNSTEDALTNLVMSKAEMTGNSVRSATVLVATVPILVVYPFVQRYFVKGVMVGALKG